MMLKNVEKKLIIEIDSELLGKYLQELKRVVEEDDLTLQNFIINLELVLKDARDY